MSSTGSAISLGNKPTDCPLCHNSVQGRNLFNHFLTKHENQVLANSTKESIQECIDLKHAFLAHNEDGIVSQGCLGCKKGFSSFNKASNHFQQDHQCQTKHIAALQHLKTLAKKGGQYTPKELQEYQKNHLRYKPLDQSDKNRCGYLFLAHQIQGLDNYLTRSIKQVGIINTDFDMAVKILETVNKQLQVTDVQQIYTTDWYRLCARAWKWIEAVQDMYFRPTYAWDFMRFTPFPQTSCDPLQTELALYLNGDVETYKYQPIDLQCVKEYDSLKYPSDSHEKMKMMFEEDLRRMKDMEEQMKQDKLEMAKRLKALDERAMMYEGNEEEEEESDQSSVIVN